MALDDELEAELQSLRLQTGSQWVDAHLDLAAADGPYAEGGEFWVGDRSALECHNGVLEYTNGDRYEGGTLAGLRHGQGRHSCSNGDSYAGQWYRDQRQGTGTANFARGAEYSGAWVADCAEGEGTAVYENGCRYSGTFVTDKRCGWGKQNFPDGSWYEGEWDHDCMHGQGRLTRQDGCFYQGEWSEGERLHGSWQGWDGEVYAGDWKGMLRHGQGMLIQPGFAKYSGGWVEDMQEGQGQALYVDGSSYEGQWKAGLRHGQGRLIGPGLQYDGAWKEGRQHGRGLANMDSGDRYNGEWQDGKRHGRGRCTFPSGDRYDGQWQDDKQHGDGTCAYKCGDRYTGQWEAGQRHGQGLCLFADGMRFRGEWAEDGWVQSMADPALSRVHGAGMARAVAGVPSSFVIQARDDLRNKRLCGGDIFTVCMLGPKQVQAGIQDHDDGTYTASYSSELAGMYQLHISNGKRSACCAFKCSSYGAAGTGEPVAESPYPLRVVPASPCTKRCTVAGSGCRFAVCGKETEFYIEARDGFDNRCTYTPTAAGFYRLTVTSDSQAIRGSPFSVQVSEDAVAAQRDLQQVQEQIPDLGRRWWQVAAATFKFDDDMAGWDSDDSQPPETSEQRYIKEHPEVPVVDNMEDLWKVAKLQRERKVRKAMAELQQQPQSKSSMGAAA